MAGATRLSVAGPGRRLAVLLALVIGVHMVALAWLHRQLELSSVLRPMATPMFTRLLTPEAPPVMPAVVAQVEAPRPRVERSSVRTVDKPAAVSPRGAASTPAKDPSEVSDVELGPLTPRPPPPEAAPPAPPPVAAASAPAPVASAPMAAASAPRVLTMDSWPVDTRLNYRLGGNYRGEIFGSANVQWQRVNDTYQARVEASVNPFGGLVLTSQGVVTPQALVPRAYEELRGSRPRNVKLGETTITFNDGRQAPRPAGVQDTASQFVELAHRFASGQEALEVGRNVTFWMARPGAVDEWTYDIVEREVLKTPAFGPVEAFHLKPRPLANPRGNITAEMWFAPSLQYLPVRIKINLGEGNFIDLLVEKIEQR